MRVLQFILIAVLFFSCDQSPKLVFEPPDNMKGIDSFVKELPYTRDGKLSPYVDDIKFTERELRLGQIGNGVDSAEIRMWLEYPEIDTAQLIIIKNEDGSWLGNAYSIRYKNEGDSTKYDFYEKIDLVPSSGWNKFIKRLLELKVSKLPNFDTLTEYMNSTHPSTIIIEVATKRFYRMYFYPVPRFNKNIKEANYINKMLDFIEKETRFKRIGRL